MPKGPEAFRSISEASEALGVAQHVLRFWETKFSFIRPMKRAGGRRFYRPYDLAVLAEVRRLLHEDGYTIKGVQRLHREQGMRRLLDAANGISAPPPAEPPLADDTGFTSLADAGRRRLEAVLAALEKAKAELDALLPG